MKSFLSLLIVILLLSAITLAAAPVPVPFTLQFRSDYDHYYALNFTYPYPALINGTQRHVMSLALGENYANDDSWSAVGYRMGVGDPAADKYKAAAVLMAWADAGLITGNEAQWAVWLINEQDPQYKVWFDANGPDPTTNKHVDALVVLVPQLVKLYPAAFYREFVVYQGTGPDSFQGADSQYFIFLARAGE